MKRARDNTKQQRLSIPLTTIKTSLKDNLCDKTSVKSVFLLAQLVYCNSYIKDNNNNKMTLRTHQVEHNQVEQVDHTKLNKWITPS